MCIPNIRKKMGPSWSTTKNNIMVASGKPRHFPAAVQVLKLPVETSTRLMKTKSWWNPRNRHGLLISVLSVIGCPFAGCKWAGWFWHSYGEAEVQNFTDFMQERTRSRPDRMEHMVAYWLSSMWKIAAVTGPWSGMAIRRHAGPGKLGIFPFQIIYRDFWPLAHIPKLEPAVFSGKPSTLWYWDMRWTGRQGWWAYTSGRLTAGSPTNHPWQERKMIRTIHLQGIMCN